LFVLLYQYSKFSPVRVTSDLKISSSDLLELKEKVIVMSAGTAII